MIELPIVAKHLGPLLERHRQSIDILRERADQRDGVIYFDVSDLDLEGYNKFIPYLLYPECAVFGGRERVSPTRAKVSVGTNPWKEPDAGRESGVAERKIRRRRTPARGGDLVRPRRSGRGRARWRKEIAAKLRR